MEAIEGLYLVQLLVLLPLAVPLAVGVAGVISWLLSPGRWAVR